MKPTTSTRTTKPRTPEQQDERRGLGYAATFHALLILLMLFGFWASPKNPNPVQIELWANGTTPTAAPAETEPKTPDTPTPPPKPVPPPKETPPPKPTPPVPTPPPTPAPPPPVVAPPKPEVDPEIALEKARKERQKEEQKQAAQQAAEKAAAEKAAIDLAAKQAKAEAAKKAAAEKAAAQKAAAAEKAAEKAAQEKAAAEKAAAAKATADKKAKADAAKKAAEEKAAEEKAAEEKAAADKAAKAEAAKKAAAEKAAAAKRDALRKAMRGDALGAAGIPGGTADRNQSGGGGNDNGYAAKVAACVRPHVAYPVPPRAGANPTVQYLANLDAQGHVTHVEVQRSSGIQGFDRAVATGIQNCSPFPKPPSGRYPSYVTGDYRMYE